ncbi:MAG: shikimate kinase [Gemmatimonadales bacterium]
MKRHIILIGLPGSGKTTIGRMVAERLKTSFVDSDMVIVRKMGMPISRIFAIHGEQKFRELERTAMHDALADTPSVIAPGGGWAAQPGQLDSARANSYIVYLRTLALTAAKRLDTEAARPMLVGQDPVEFLRNLYKEREPFFSTADAEIKNDVKTAEQAAEEVVALAREHAGW